MLYEGNVQSSIFFSSGTAHTYGGGSVCIEMYSFDNYSGMLETGLIGKARRFTRLAAVFDAMLLWTWLRVTGCGPLGADTR